MMEAVTGEMIAIIGAAVFLAVKFGIGNLLKTFTTHRGLIHSIPFCILSGQIIFLIADGDMASRILKAAGLSLGFFSHLLLDEIYSVEVVQGKLNKKKSSGTAIKFGMRKHLHLTIILYIVLGFATYIAIQQPGMIGSALDRALDHIAGLTIRGAQHFETMSSNAQQSLRGKTTNGDQPVVPLPDAIPRIAGNTEPANDPSMRHYAMPVIEPAFEPVITQSPVNTPTNPMVSQTPTTRPLLIRELEPPRPNGRPPLLSELEQIRSSGVPQSTSQIPPARPVY
jgi:hypothetical protein